MNVNELLNGFECECGKRHDCSIKSVFVESGAIAKRLPALCEGFGKILLVADGNTYAAAGDKVKSALSGKDTSSVIFDGDSLLIPNEEAVLRVTSAISGAELIIAIGSGVIQDLCKYVSHVSKIPYVDVATAPSMDGYASDGAAMILSGMKETVKCGLPLSIVADVDVLKNAPLDMIRAGFGDIVGKYSALCDWRLSNIVNGEYLCERIYSVTEEMITKTLSLAEGLLLRREESVAALMEALVVVGIMMSFAGSSRPASGSEHHLSHFFEIVGIVKNEEYFPHGIDVAYSTVVTTELRERLAGCAFPDKKHEVSRDEYENKMKQIYEKVADGCIALQDKVGNYATDRTKVYIENEKKIKALFASVPSAEKIQGYLSLVGLDIKDFYAKYGEKKIKEAISYAKDLKDRYSVLWLYYDLFGEYK